MRAVRDLFVMPCVFASLPNKKQDTYKMMWHSICAEFVRGVLRVLLEFERAAHNALMSVHKDAAIRVATPAFAQQ